MSGGGGRGGGDSGIDEKCLLATTKIDQKQNWRDAAAANGGADRYSSNRDHGVLTQIQNTDEDGRNMTVRVMRNDGGLVGNEVFVIAVTSTTLNNQ